MILVSIALFSGCSKEGRAPAPEVPQQPAKVEPAATPEPAAIRLPTTPEGFYAMCEGRVEGPSEAGECSTDADCGTTGCSGEVCVATANADLTTTCELAPCFQVLDTCGCREGRCSWSLKPTLPDPLKQLVERVNGG